MTTITATELAKRLGLDTRTLRLAAQEGRIPGAYKSGATWLFDEAAQQEAAKIVPGKGQHWRRRNGAEGE